MDQTKRTDIRNFYFHARARVRGVVKIFLLLVVLVPQSSGLINAAPKTKQAADQSNPGLTRLRHNQDLAKKNASDAERTLIEALKSDTDPIVRQAAAQTLGNYSQNPLVVRAIADALLNDTDKAVRCAAALSLGLSPTFKSITALERAANDPDPDLRRQIAFSLQRHRKGQNKRKAEDLLKKLKRDADPSVRAMAIEAAR